MAGNKKEAGKKFEEGQAPDKQYQPKLQSSEYEPGALAVTEFAQIVNLLSTVSVTPLFQKSKVNCPEKPRWCLPDVNCAARVTFSQKAIEAFKENQEFCKPPTQIP